jgi:Tfp pilus assembly protein FimV
MDAEKKAQIQAHARALAALLYEETDPEQVKTLAGIEAAVRGHLLEHVSPEIGDFLLQQAAVPRVDESAASIVSSDDCR